MSRPLNDRERMIRSNIRNAFFAESQETIEQEVERRRDREDFLAVRFLNELLEESFAEYLKEYELKMATRMDTDDMLETIREY